MEMLQWFTFPFIKSRQRLVGRSGTVHGIPPLVLGSRVKKRWRLGIEYSESTWDVRDIESMVLSVASVQTPISEVLIEHHSFC